LEGRVVLEVAREIHGDVMQDWDVAHEEKQRQILYAMAPVPLSRQGSGPNGNLGEAKAALSEAPTISSLSRMRSRDAWIGKSFALGFAG
jgi:hypothetical protein